MSEEKNRSEGKFTDDTPQPVDDNLQGKYVNLQPSTEPHLLADIHEQTTIITSQPFDCMEVHHHGHVHEKKKWKEYVFQFLMLFLAVFCGFLAEYQLEHKIERDRELQFIQSLSADLQDDVKGLEALINFEKGAVLQLDTLITLLNDPVLARLQGNQLYYLARMGPRAHPFANNNRTFDQLRNSGGFRLITNRTASGNITNYYNKFSPVRLLESNYDLEFNSYKQLAAKILDPIILKRQERVSGEIGMSSGNPELRTYNSETLKELSYHTIMMAGTRKSKLGMLEDLKLTAIELRKSLQTHYYLNND